MAFPGPAGARVVLTAIMWGSLFTMSMPPHVTIINERGETLGTPDEVGPETGQDADGFDDDTDGGFDDDTDGRFDDGGFDGGD